MKQVVEEILPWLRKRAQILKVDLNQEPEIEGVDGDLALVFGGDGTLLSAARVLGGREIPLLGINMGKLGFLTELTVENMKQALERILNKKLCTERHMMLRCDVIRNGASIGNYSALNDAVVTRQSFARLLDVRLFFNGEYVASYSGDGLIVSTPVGSTAHSLSAGGPIVNPSLEAFVITPICPHTLSNRPLVIPADTRVRIEPVPPLRNAILTLDGQIYVKIRSRDVVEVRRSKKNLFLARAGEWNYYQILKDKFHWGGPPDHGKSKGKSGC